MEIILLYLIIYLAEAYIWGEYVSNIFQPKYTKRFRISMLILIYLGLFWVSRLKVINLNLLFFILANFVFILLFYHAKWYIAFFHATTAAAIMGLCELATYSLLLPNATAADSFSKLIICMIFSKTIYFTILFFLPRVFTEKDHLFKPNDKTIFLLVAIPIISFVIMTVLFSISSNYNLAPSHERLISISSVLLLSINLIMFFFYSHMRKKNEAFVEMQILLQKEHDFSEYYKLLMKQSENQSILIHDIKNHLHSISLLNQQGNSEQIDAYIQQLTKSFALQSAVRVCDNELMNMVLYRYQAQCTEKGIHLHLDIRNHTTDFLTDNDLTSLFCNLLDNSIEAAEKTQNGYIELNIDQVPNTAFSRITMINSCRVSPFSHGGTQLVTHKSDKLRHGYGMKSVERIVNKYNGNLQTYYDSNTATFHTIITLKRNTA